MRPVFHHCLPAYTDRASSESCYDAGFPAQSSVRLSPCSPASCLSYGEDCEAQTLTVLDQYSGLFAAGRKRSETQTPELTAADKFLHLGIGLSFAPAHEESYTKI